MNNIKEYIYYTILTISILISESEVKAQTELKFFGGIGDGYSHQEVILSLLIDDNKYFGGINDGYNSEEEELGLTTYPYKYAGGIADGFAMSQFSTYLLTNIAKYTGGVGDGYSSFYSALEIPFPVELILFTARVKENILILNWVTSTETNNYGFEIERKAADNWLKIGFVEGYGNSNSPRTYLFTDENPVGGNKFYYRLKQVDTDGLFKYSDIVEANLTPTEFALYQNYPNPFNPNTTIKYQIPRECSVSIKVYDLLGAEILELLNEKKQPGIYEIEFNAASLPSGVYLYKLTDGHFTDSKKMLLLK